MSYKKILNPLDGKLYSIFEGTGKDVLKKYIKQMKKGGANFIPSDFLFMNIKLEKLGYKFVRGLGKGSYGLVGLYEKDRKKYAIKSSLNSRTKTDVLINERVKTIELNRKVSERIESIDNLNF